LHQKIASRIVKANSKKPLSIAILKPTL